MDIRVKTIMTPEGKEAMKQASLEYIDVAIEHLLEMRRINELHGVMTTEEFDEELNKACDKWHELFGSMDAEQMSAYMLMKRLMGEDEE